MQNTLRVQILGALALGAFVAMPVNAAETPKGPSSVSESAPDKTGKEAKGAAGTATMPTKGPASANESAPQKTGKEPPAPAVKADSKKMPNPKTPASVSESAPDKTGSQGTGEKSYGKKTIEKEKSKEGAAR
jgi:hypothetical protein